MRVPSRSKKTAFERLIPGPSYLRNARLQLGQGHGSGAQLADHDAAGEICQLSGFGGRGSRDKSQGKYRDRRIAGTGNVENGVGASGGVVRRLLAREKQHALLTQGNQETVALPTPEQAPAGLEQGLILQNRKDRVGIRQ